jgi:hypothetical protein
MSKRCADVTHMYINLLSLVMVIAHIAKDCLNFILSSIALMNSSIISA